MCKIDPKHDKERFETKERKTKNETKGTKKYAADARKIAAVDSNKHDWD